MGTRAHYQENLTDRKGNVLAGASVHVYDQGTTDPISETIYAGDTGVVATLSNPITADADGLFEIWLDDPARVDILVVHGGHTSEARTIDVTRTPNDGGYVLESLIDAKGDLILGTAADTVGRKAIGADDTILMADAAQSTGVKWQAPATTSEIADIADTESAGTSDTWARGDHVHSGAAYVLKSLVDAAGDLLVGSADNTLARLAKGTALQYLRTNSGATALEWATLDTIAASLIDAAGDLIVGTADNTAGRLAKGTALQILRVNSGATALEWATNTKTIRIGHTFAIKGTAANGEVPGFYVSLPSGQTAVIALARYSTESGTVTAQVRKNGSALPDLTALSVSSTDATTDESPDVALADNDYIDLNLSSASSPVDLRFTVFVEYSV